MKLWKGFENRIREECQLQGITCIKIPEQIVQAGGGKHFRRKTAFDYAAGIDGIAAFFDAKSSGRDLYLESYITDEKKIHQFTALKAAYENFNIAGYLIHFYQEFTIAWAPIQVVHGLINTKQLKITPTTPGLTKQMDNVPINLRTLLWEDRAQLMRKLCKGNSSAVTT